MIMRLRKKLFDIDAVSFSVGHDLLMRRDYDTFSRFFLGEGG